MKTVKFSIDIRDYDLRNNEQGREEFEEANTPLDGYIESMVWDGPFAVMHFEIDEIMNPNKFEKDYRSALCQVL